jgi:hypothetical protein
LIAEFLERRRPPPRLRKDVDLAFRVNRQSIEIFEIRSHWTGKGKPTEHRIAKAVFTKRTGKWKVLCEGADLKWQRYKPNPEVESIDEFLGVIQNDAGSHFFG